MSAGHTPTPWRTNSECGDESVLGPNGAMVADCAIFGMSAAFRKRGGDNVANARFICRAVNAHDDLVEALRKAESAINAAFFQVDAENRGHDRKADQYDLIVREGRDAIRAALSKALTTNPTGEVK